MVFQILFRISLNDIHNSFHRMKTRAGSRTLFLDQLKYSLEEYMNREDTGLSLAAFFCILAMDVIYYIYLNNKIDKWG